MKVQQKNLPMQLPRPPYQKVELKPPGQQTRGEHTLVHSGPWKSIRYCLKFLAVLRDDILSDATDCTKQWLTSGL
jgi:hypothetical protein